MTWGGVPGWGQNFISGRAAAELDDEYHYTCADVFGTGFLESREKEVVSIMMTLFDEERIMRNYVASERREAVRDAVENMLKTGKMSAEEIAGYFTELSVEDVREIEKGLLQT